MEKNIKEKKKIKIGIVGLGMVGTPIMKWLFSRGFERGKSLFCYDADSKKGYFDNVSEANIIFICVPTPPNPDGSCNTSIVESVVSQFADSQKILVIKSTVPPGTTESLAKKYKCDLLFNPEFLTEAQAWEDFIKPDRQIVGYATDEARKWASLILNHLPIATFHSPGVIGTYKFHEASSTEAEITKYGGNAFGAMKVVFANVIADLCELAGANYENVRHLISHDRRIGGAWMDVNHGDYRGFGGFCFPKDLDALIARYKEKFDEFKKKNGGDKKMINKYKHAIAFLEAIKFYNKALLESQDLALDEISHHDTIVQEKMKNKK